MSAQRRHWTLHDSLSVPFSFVAGPNNTKTWLCRPSSLNHSRARTAALPGRGPRTLEIKNDWLQDKLISSAPPGPIGPLTNNGVHPVASRAWTTLIYFIRLGGCVRLRMISWEAAVFHWPIDKFCSLRGGLGEFLSSTWFGTVIRPGPGSVKVHQQKHMEMLLRVSPFGSASRASACKQHVSSLLQLFQLYNRTGLPRSTGFFELKLLFIHNSQGDQDPCFHPGSSLTYMEFGPDAPAKP